jgi:hypothetical protein
MAKSAARRLKKLPKLFSRRNPKVVAQHDAVLEDEDERQLQQSKMSSTSNSSINEEEDLEITAGGDHSQVEYVIQHTPQHLHIDLSMPGPYDEQEDQEEEEEHHSSPLEYQNLADEQVSTMAQEDYEDVFDGLDDDDDDGDGDGFEGVDKTPAKSDSMPGPYDEQEDQEEEEEHHPSPLEYQNLADEQVSTMAQEDYEDVFDGLDDDDDDDGDGFEGVDKTPAKSDSDDGEDQVIGIVIQYDITSDMLREGGIPENASRTKLRSLQKAESYEANLLDSHVEHSESSSDASFDFGNFDQFEDFGALDNWKAQDNWKMEDLRQLEVEEDKDIIRHSSLYSDEEEIEIVFYAEGEEPEDKEEEQVPINLESYNQDDIEIRFFNCREDEDTDAGSTEFDDCHSEFAPSPDVKIERKHPFRHSIDLEGDECSLDTPPYEWFLPEHTDNYVAPIKHTPKYMDIKKDVVNSRSTPNTLQTVSLSFEESDHDSLVSHGSAISEAIQDLVFLCRSKQLLEI